MSWFKNNKTEWKEIIDAVSTELKRNPLTFLPKKSPIFYK